MIAGRDHAQLLSRFGRVMVRRPGGRAVISFSRRGVLQTGGCFPLAPAWLATRLAWRVGDQEWAVRLARGGGRRIFDQELRSEVVASRDEAAARALAWLAEVESGSLDPELRSG